VRKGSLDAIKKWVIAGGGTFPPELDSVCSKISMQGGTPLVVSEGARALGVIHLKDVVKSGIKERFVRLRKMGIKTIMITGDNPLTASDDRSGSGCIGFRGRGVAGIEARTHPRRAEERPTRAMIATVRTTRRLWRRRTWE